MRNIRFFTILVLLSSFIGCRKVKKAENTLFGNWIVNKDQHRMSFDADHPFYLSTAIEYSGELSLDEKGDGYLKITGTGSDTIMVLFDKDVYGMDVNDHQADLDLNDMKRHHWYQGYFNDDIYFSFRSSDHEVVNENTEQIELHIGGLINNETGVWIERYDINVSITR
ncbi:MAG: hypothetical protein JXQ87_19080 [Bacteroidia bacterium]